LVSSKKPAGDFPMKMTIIALASALLLGGLPAFAQGGGRDHNGDQGRDKMHESNVTVRPNDPSKK
jgi:hypothetical protein